MTGRVRLGWSLLLLLGFAVPAGAEKKAPPVEHVVVGRLVSGPKHVIACGVVAFIGVYVYEVEEVVSGPPLAGPIVVDVLCPDFYAGKDGPKLRPGERHRLELRPAHREYAGATAPPSPLPAAPRFAARAIHPVGSAKMGTRLGAMRPAYCAEANSKMRKGSNPGWRPS